MNIILKNLFITYKYALANHYLLNPMPSSNWSLTVPELNAQTFDRHHDDILDSCSLVS